MAGIQVNPKSDPQCKLVCRMHLRVVSPRVYGSNDFAQRIGENLLLHSLYRGLYAKDRCAHHRFAGRRIRVSTTT